MRPSKLLRNATFRLALLYLALFSLSVLLLFGFIYWATVGYQSRQLDITINTELQQLTTIHQQSGTSSLINTIQDQINRRIDRNQILALIDSNNFFIAGNIDDLPRRARTDGWLEFEVELDNDRHDDDIDIRALIQTLPDGLRLLVGRNIEPLERQHELILEAMLWGLIITIALGLTGGLVLSISSLRKIERISRTGRAIMAGDLSQRIPLPKLPADGGNDVDQLAVTLNAMLDQIQALMDSLRQVSNDIAHDLRTPLTRLRGQLEELQSQTSDEILLVQIDEAIAEVDGMLVTFNALLRIAQVEANAAREDFAPIDLATVVQDVAELFEPLASANDLTLTVDSAKTKAFSFLGDRDLIFQALVNLLDNAIKYTPAGGAIELTVSVSAKEVYLTVADNGPGIPDSEHERVVQRFYRLEKHRSQTGNGLGLSLVAAVAKRHGGQLLLVDNQPGLRATLVLPVTKKGLTAL